LTSDQIGSKIAETFASIFSEYLTFMQMNRFFDILQRISWNNSKSSKKVRSSLDFFGERDRASFSESNDML